MGIIAASSLAASLAVAIVGGVVAGTGSGVAQMNAMAAVQRIAPLHIRGSVVSAYFTICYVALSVPVFVAGEVADHLGLEVVTAWYFVGLAVVVGCALLLSRHPDAPWSRSSATATDPGSGSISSSPPQQPQTCRSALP